MTEDLDKLIKDMSKIASQITNIPVSSALPEEFIYTVNRVRIAAHDLVVTINGFLDG